MTERQLLTTLKNLNHWFVDHDFRGHDPFQLDQAYFSRSNSLIRPVMQAARSMAKPFHAFIPELLFRHQQPITHPKALGLIISGNANLFQMTGDRYWLDQSDQLLDLLLSCKAQTHWNSWGHPFEWGSESRYPINYPLVCVTAPIGLWLLDLYEVNKDPRVLEATNSAMRNLLEENTWRESINQGEKNVSICYSVLDQRCTYNGAAYVAALLTRYQQILGGKKFDRKIQSLLNFVRSGQNTDGSWYYSDLDRLRGNSAAIDNRHTGFILELLTIVNLPRKDDQLFQTIQKGKKFYNRHLFHRGLPKWSPSQEYPIDIHDVAQAIKTWTIMGDLTKANKLADFAIYKMSNGRDAFYYKHFANGTSNKTTFFRWGQAWMYNALSYLALQSINNKGR